MKKPKAVLQSVIFNEALSILKGKKPFYAYHKGIRRNIGSNPI